MSANAGNGKSVVNAALPRSAPNERRDTEALAYGVVRLDSEDAWGELVRTGKEVIVRNAVIIGNLETHKSVDEHQYLL